MSQTQIIYSIKTKIDSLTNGKYWTNFLGLGRSSLALGLLLTLLFNSHETLFSFGLQNEMNPTFNQFNFLSIYNIIGDFYIAKLISIFVLIIVITGIYPRFTCILHWWVTYSFFITSFAVDGGDQINNILTFLLIPICITDNRKNHWKNEKLKNGEISKIIAFYGYLLIEIQVAFLYFQAVVGKFGVNEWLNGTAVYYWFTNVNFGMNSTLYPFIIPILKNPFGVLLITWSVLLLEFFLFTSVFIKNQKIKKLAWVTGILFHLGIIIIHGLVSFFFSMLGALTLYLMAKNKNFK